MVQMPSDLAQQFFLLLPQYALYHSLENLNRKSKFYFFKSNSIFFHFNQNFSHYFSRILRKTRVHMERSGNFKKFDIHDCNWYRVPCNSLHIGISSLFKSPWLHERSSEKIEKEHKRSTARGLWCRQWCWTGKKKSGRNVFSGPTFQWLSLAKSYKILWKIQCREWNISRIAKVTKMNWSSWRHLFTLEITDFIHLPLFQSWVLHHSRCEWC